MSPLGFALLAFAGIVSLLHFAPLALSEVGQPYDVAGVCFGAMALLLAAFLLTGAQ